MAKREDFKMSTAERLRRRFSDGFKQEKVKEIEQGKTRICEVCREYEVTYPSVYKWIAKFGKNKDKPERVIVESKSDTKKLLELKKKVAELERTVGQKQIQIDFKEKMIELAEEHYQIDIKKKFSGEPFKNTGKTEKK